MQNQGRSRRRLSIGAAVVAVMAWMLGVTPAEAATVPADAGWGTNGRSVVTAHCPGSQRNGGMQSFVLPTGELVRAVHCLGGDPELTSLLLTRTGADGRPDTRFGNGGTTVITTVGRTLYSYSDRFSVVADPQGRLVLYLGNFDDKGAPLQLLMRVTRDGRIDRSFNRGVVRLRAVRGVERAAADFGTVHVDSHGRVVVVEEDRQGDYHRQGDAIVRRFGVDGRLDPTFDRDGIKRVNGWSGGVTQRAWLTGSALDGDRLVLAYSGQTDVGDVAENRLVVRRLRVNGSADPGFGTKGFAGLRFPRRGVSSAALGVDTRQRPVLLAHDQDSDSSRLYRLTSAGKLDRGFDGRVGGWRRDGAACGSQNLHVSTTIVVWRSCDDPSSVVRGDRWKDSGTRAASFSVPTPFRSPYQTDVDLDASNRMLVTYSTAARGAYRAETQRYVLP